MPQVRIPMTPPTEVEFRVDRNLIGHLPPEDRPVVARADCPFFHLQRGGLFWASGERIVSLENFQNCAHPNAPHWPYRRGFALPCKGKRCNCPLTVHSWLQAWADGDIEEFVPGGDE